MEDLGENTTVLSSLRSLNNFISQRVDGGAGLDTAAPGFLQMQYHQSMQVSVVGAASLAQTLSCVFPAVRGMPCIRPGSLRGGAGSSDVGRRTVVPVGETMGT